VTETITTQAYTETRNVGDDVKEHFAVLDKLAEEFDTYVAMQYGSTVFSEKIHCEGVAEGYGISLSRPDPIKMQN